jgi:hypothetical protein
MKYITLLVTSMALLGCSNSAPSKPLPAKKTFVKKETNTAPSNRNSHYPPVGVGGYYPVPMGHQVPPHLQQHQNNNSVYNGGGYYVEPLGNGPLTHQNSAEDIENQRQGRD